jgi:hypothetical protein
MKIINIYMNLMKSLPFSLRPRVVGEWFIAIVVSPWWTMLLKVDRVALRFRVRMPVIAFTVIVGIPKLATPPTRVLFTFGTLHVIATTF